MSFSVILINNSPIFIHIQFLLCYSWEKFDVIISSVNVYSQICLIECFLCFPLRSWTVHQWIFCLIDLIRFYQTFVLVLLHWFVNSFWIISKPFINLMIQCYTFIFNISCYSMHLLSIKKFNVGPFARVFSLLELFHIIWFFIRSHLIVTGNKRRVLCLNFNSLPKTQILNSLENICVSTECLIFFFFWQINWVLVPLYIFILYPVFCQNQSRCFYSCFCFLCWPFSATSEGKNICHYENKVVKYQDKTCDNNNSSQKQSHSFKGIM